MKITDLIDNLQIYAAINPNLIVVVRVHSDYRPAINLELTEMAKYQDGTWYTAWTTTSSTDKIEKVLAIEG
jgi:hypothetical protein